jgi:nicotinate-nucleotide pyrophosphorylase (carboxylating)
MTIEQHIRLALEEDLGSGDHTSLSTIPAHARGKARLVAKESGVLAGVRIAEMVYKQIDSATDIKIFINDGEKINKGDIIFEVSGKSIAILSAERLALNYMQRMSGIATTTSKYIALLEGTKTQLLDTRKTTPLMRLLEKEAVVLGGAKNHRMGLYDMIMIKDNHVDFSGGIIQAIDACHKYLTKNDLRLKIEIEVRNMNELEIVLEKGGIDRIMLDNFDPETLKEAIGKIGHRFETEASGGITADNLRVYAETGVDYISVGALTHQIKSLDLSLQALL